MKDLAIQSPMGKFKVIEPTLNVNWSEKYFVGFHFNRIGTILVGDRFILHKFTNKDHPNVYICMSVL